MSVNDLIDDTQQPPDAPALHFRVLNEQKAVEDHGFCDTYGQLNAPVDTSAAETLGLWFSEGHDGDENSELKFLHEQCRWEYIIPQYILYALRRNPRLLTFEPSGFIDNLLRVLIEKQKLYNDSRVQSLFDSNSDGECLNNMLEFSREYSENDEITDIYQRYAKGVSESWKSWMRSAPKQYNYKEEGISFLQLGVPFGSPFQFMKIKLQHFST